MDYLWCHHVIRAIVLLVCCFVTSGSLQSHSCRRSTFLETVSYLTYQKNDDHGVCHEELTKTSTSRNCMSRAPNFHPTKLTSNCMIDATKTLTSCKGENKSKAVDVKSQNKKQTVAIKKLKGSKRQRKKNKKKKLSKKKKKS